jgi:hypothetical protein
MMVPLGGKRPSLSPKYTCRAFNQLAHVGRTGHLLGLSLGPGDAGDDDTDQYPNDRHHHQQLNQGEAEVLLGLVRHRTTLAQRRLSHVSPLDDNAKHRDLFRGLMDSAKATAAA